MGRYRVIYFHGRGRAEILRMTLRAANVDFEDVRLTREEWQAQKATSPTGYLPILELPDGTRMTQSLACARYLGSLFGFMGKDTWHQYLVDRAVDQGLDFVAGLAVPLLAPAEQKDALLTEFMNKDGWLLLQGVNQFLLEAGGEFFAGNYITIADIWWCAILSVMKKEFNHAIAQFPDLLSLYKRVHERNDGLLRWEGERPESAW